MKRLAGLMALAVLLSFGTVTTLTYAGDPPAPTDEKDKGKDQEKKPGSPKAEPDSKDEKKDDKGGK